MTPAQACDIASHYAGSGRDGFWNPRFVEGLSFCGYGLKPVTLTKGCFIGQPNVLIAPRPVATERWQYPYPSILVPMLSEYDETQIAVSKDDDGATRQRLR